MNVGKGGLARPANHWFAGPPPPDTVTPRPLTRLPPNPPPAVRLPLVLAALLTAFLTAAQTTTLTLTGRVLDANTSAPVAYAHVGVATEAIGTATGHDGRFELKLPPGLAAAEFSVSSIGYDTYRVPVRDFGAGAVIRLKPSVTSLTEIVVTDPDFALGVVRRAVRAIPDNYPDAPSNSRVFYRESLTDDSLRYRYLAEGVLDVYKTSYANTKEGQVGIVQGRKINLQDPLDTTVRSGFTSGHMAAHRFDVVKNREDFLDEAFFPVYRYRLERMTSYDGQPVYVIAFAQNPDAHSEGKPRRKRGSLLGNITGGLLSSPTRNDNAGRIEARLEGRVFIQKGSYAILRAEFEVTDEGLRRYSDYPLYSGRWAGNVYTVNYRQTGERWTFSDALREGFRRGGALYVNEVKTTALVDGDGNQIPYLRRVGRDDQFVDLTGRYTEDFWRDYNVLPMREGLSEGMRQFEIMRTADLVFGRAYQDSLQQVRDSIRAAELAAEAAARAETRRAEEAVNRDRARWTDREGEFESPRARAPDRETFGVRSLLGFGVHGLPVRLPPLTIAYANSVGNQQLFFESGVTSSDLAALFQGGLDFRFRRHAFVRYQTAFDLGPDIYKQQAIGIGVEANLTPRRRPVVVRGVAQYEWLRYYRTLGRADVVNGPIEVDGRRFKGDEVRLGYGAQRHGLKLSAELAIEQRRGREVFVRATYHRHLLNRAGVWFKETRQVFRKDEPLSVRASELTVRSGDADYDAAIVPAGTWSVSVGWVFD